MWRADNDEFEFGTFDGPIAAVRRTPAFTRIDICIKIDMDGQRTVAIIRHRSTKSTLDEPIKSTVDLESDDILLVWKVIYWELKERE
ncbi:hypothetical protein M413DRAFT_442381 [Hebeloma cylindrosporum]|uniref:Uncharacterized protein n=1 Tax=Hebeloma cylindrosporum TaxID=76867 RepID=A0A0C3C681_HEBCY|nr:hypothetical protein M413DRAFT_442381 [Hebeloma cylindrosporum h7]